MDQIPGRRAEVERLGFRYGVEPRLRFDRLPDTAGLICFSFDSYLGTGVIERAPVVARDPTVSRTQTPWYEYVGHVEAVYASLAWELTVGMQRYGIPVWDWHKAADTVGATSIEHVRWECRGGEFVEARSWDPTDPIDRHPWYRHLDYTGFFGINAVRDISHIMRECHDQGGMRLSLFGLKDESRFTEAAIQLQDDCKPEMHQILGQGEWFIDLDLGEHAGYQPDRITVATTPDQEDRFHTSLAEVRKRITAYEESVTQVITTADELAALELLRGPT